MVLRRHTINLTPFLGLVKANVGDFLRFHAFCSQRRVRSIGWPARRCTGGGSRAAASVGRRPVRSRRRSLRRLPSPDRSHRLSAECPAAFHVDGLLCDAPSVVREEEQHWSRDIVGPAKSAEQHEVSKLGPSGRIRVALLQQVCVDERRMNKVAPGAALRLSQRQPSPAHRRPPPLSTSLSSLEEHIPE